MGLDKSLIGIESETEVFAVERGEATPPTFPTTFRVKIPGLAAVDPARFIHANAEYVYGRPLRAGDRVACRRKVVDLFHKDGRLGPMTSPGGSFRVTQVES